MRILSFCLALFMAAVVVDQAAQVPYAQHISLFLLLSAACLNFIQGRIRLETDRELLFTYLFLLGAVLWGLLLTHARVTTINLEVAYGLGMLLLLPALAALARDGYFKVLESDFMLIMSISCPLLATYSLYKLNQTLHLQFPTFLVGAKPGPGYPMGTSLVTDYNMFSLTLSVGAVCSLAVFLRSRILVQKIATVASLAVIVPSILLSGSRRGVLFVVVGLLFLFFRAAFAGFGSRGSFRRTASMVVFLGVVVGGVFVAATELTSDPATLREVLKIPALSRVSARISLSNDPSKGQEEPRLKLVKASEDILSRATPVQLLVGQGFDYLQELKGPGGVEDYPHNPVLAAILYSGYAGALAVVAFLSRATYFYARDFRKYGVLTGVFVVTSFYSIVSTDTIFSLPIWTLLLIFGYLLRFGVNLSADDRGGEPLPST